MGGLIDQLCPHVNEDSASTANQKAGFAPARGLFGPYKGPSYRIGQR
ncbi:hypothetical protein OHAE_2676 [Ochrobactrum soli]|uniref:Uncharacterized protein n=1 Tax=Ochrobactrum soli TaxID=2448455 RepID=A0A2P9HRT3_9HYPH|nr:hypothetical protein OHAE_2676 [[Ochrobactrum] soli]